MSLLPDAAEMAAIRADIEATTMPDTGHVLSVSLVADGQGGVTETWGTATANVACRLDPVRGQEEQAGGAVMPFFTYVLSMEYGTVITEADRFKIGTQEYNVRSVDNGKSWSAQVRAYVERV